MIVYNRKTGNTKALADAIAEGARGGIAVVFGYGGWCVQGVPVVAERLREWVSASA